MSSTDRLEGTGTFEFTDMAVGGREQIRVHYFRANSDKNAKIVLAMHGADRAASDFRDSLIAPARDSNLAVIVPEFDRESFPDAYSYNYANVRRPAPDNNFVDRRYWTFHLVDRLVDHVRCRIGSNERTFGLFGLSAGAQYVLRYLALMEAPLVDVAIAANSGWYMLPDLGLAYPFGMGGLNLAEEDVRRYFLKPLVVLLGTADTNAAAGDLPRHAEANAQGPNRYARGIWHFQHCERLARELGVNMNWRLQFVADAGHADPIMYERAIKLFLEN